MKEPNVKLQNALLAAIVFTCAVFSAYRPFEILIGIGTSDIILGDMVDAPILVKGLESTHNFQDTLKWWYGPWVAGAEYAFYRPLTSLGFWLQYQTFGREGVAGFTTVHAISHVVAVLSAFAFLWVLLGRWVAAAASCFFAMSWTLTPFQLPAAYWALHHWKDQPDLWYSTAYFLSLLGLTLFLKSGKKSVYIWSLVAFVGGVLFKEAAYSLPFIAILILCYQKKFQTHWNVLVPYFGIAAAMFSFRLWALGGIGFRFGTNGSWFERWAVNVLGGKPVVDITQGYLWPAIIAFTVAGFAVFLLSKEKRCAYGLLTVAAIAGAVQYFRSYDMTDPFYYVLLGSARPWIGAFYALLLMFAVWRCIYKRNPNQIFGWLWVLVSYIPLMTAPITSHALYLISLGWSIWMVCAIADIIQMAHTNTWVKKACFTISRLKVSGFPVDQQPLPLSASEPQQ